MESCTEKAVVQYCKLLDGDAPFRTNSHFGSREVIDQNYKDNANSKRGSAYEHLDQNFCRETRRLRKSHCTGEQQKSDADARYSRHRRMITEFRDRVEESALPNAYDPYTSRHILLRRSKSPAEKKLTIVQKKLSQQNSNQERRLK